MSEYPEGAYWWGLEYNQSPYEYHCPICEMGFHDEIRMIEHYYKHNPYKYLEEA
jgi:hypothetical protein